MVICWLKDHILSSNALCLLTAVIIGVLFGSLLSQQCVKWDLGQLQPLFVYPREDETSRWAPNIQYGGF